jgi:hypothetical protein
MPTIKAVILLGTSSLTFTIFKRNCIENFDDALDTALDTNFVVTEQIIVQRMNICVHRTEIFNTKIHFRFTQRVFNEAYNVNDKKCTIVKPKCRYKRPRCLRRGIAAASVLRLRVLILPGTRTPVCCECCELSGKGLCVGLIIRPEESYREWYV